MNRKICRKLESSIQPSFRNTWILHERQNTRYNDNLRKLRREEEGSNFWMLQHNLCFVIFVCYYVCRRMLRFRFVTRSRTLDSSKYVFSCIFLSFFLASPSILFELHERGYGSDMIKIRGRILVRIISSASSSYNYSMIENLMKRYPSTLELLNESNWILSV